MDDDMTKEQALTQAKNMGGNNFRLQMISYHFDYQPHKKSDVIYLRKEELLAI